MLITVGLKQAFKALKQTSPPPSRSPLLTQKKRVTLCSNVFGTNSGGNSCQEESVSFNWTSWWNPDWRIRWCVWWIFDAAADVATMATRCPSARLDSASQPRQQCVSWAKNTEPPSCHHDPFASVYHLLCRSVSVWLEVTLIPLSASSAASALCVILSEDC